MIGTEDLFLVGWKFNLLSRQPSTFWMDAQAFISGDGGPAYPFGGSCSRVCDFFG
jgi:hypothetical protein